jgi:predicted XRE-type DNA-binding protein
MSSDEQIVQAGSGNVFADLGLANADDHRLKAELVGKIADIMAARGLKQPAAARLMGVSQPDLSRLLRGQFRQVSADRLMKMIVRLDDTEIEITVRHHGQAVGETIHLEHREPLPA